MTAVPRPIQAFLPSLCLALALATVPARAAGDVVEQVETYSISGNTGAELYISIGDKGPLLGSTRVIAQTGFKLTWRRDYQNRGGDCVLASAVPRLVITTHLPKPAGKLSGDTARRWQTFIEGVRSHEQVHAENLKVMTREIEKATVGLSAENDPSCNKLRAKMQPLLKAISEERKAKDHAFDKAEFGDGGTVQMLILRLVTP